MSQGVPRLCDLCHAAWPAQLADLKSRAADLKSPSGPAQNAGCSCVVGLTHDVSVTLSTRRGARDWPS